MKGSMSSTFTLLLALITTFSCTTLPNEQSHDLEKIKPAKKKPEFTKIHRISKFNSPSPRAMHSAVWTPHGMMIWGGILDYSHKRVTGGRLYKPFSNTWRPIAAPESNPVSRYHHSSLWSGEHVLIWGGIGEDGIALNQGLRYDPVDDSWSEIDPEHAPSPRSGQSAVWTGDTMVIFGGEFEGSPLSDGSSYEPNDDEWVQLSFSVPQEPRSHHTAIWTGDMMIVWGGYVGGIASKTGFSLKISSGETKELPIADGFSGRIGHTSIWTGKEMIVWGGRNGDGLFFNDGMAYDPAENKWRKLSTHNAPSARDLHTTIWTGQEMIVWGGTAGRGSKNTGGIYHPQQDRWEAIRLKNNAAHMHTAIWTGEQLLIWGGRITSERFAHGRNSGFRLVPQPKAAIGH